jgi:hypothetical protein
LYSNVDYDDDYKFRGAKFIGAKMVTKFTVSLWHITVFSGAPIGFYSETGESSSHTHILFLLDLF